MNVEVIKAMNKKETKIDAIRKWWNKNGCVFHQICFLFWLFKIVCLILLLQY